MFTAKESRLAMFLIACAALGMRFTEPGSPLDKTVLAFAVFAGVVAGAPYELQIWKIVAKFVATVTIFVFLWQTPAAWATAAIATALLIFTKRITKSWLWKVSTVLAIINGE